MKMKIFIREIINISFNNLYNLSKIIKTLSNKILKIKEPSNKNILYEVLFFKKKIEWKYNKNILIKLIISLGGFN